MRRRRLPAWPTADAAAPALALGYAIGRIGCFLVGDDYGRPTDLPGGRVPRRPAAHHRRRAARDGRESLPASPDALVRVHPTQLYETALAS